MLCNRLKVKERISFVLCRSSHVTSWKNTWRNCILMYFPFIKKTSVSNLWTLCVCVCVCVWGKWVNNLLSTREHYTQERKTNEWMNEWIFNLVLIGKTHSLTENQKVTAFSRKEKREKMMLQREDFFNCVSKCFHN